MRTAAYCSECNGYVWVEQNGNCSNGHAHSNLRDVHKADSLPSPIGVAPVGPAVQPAEEPASPAGLPISLEHPSPVDDLPDEVPDAPGQPEQQYPPQPYGYPQLTPQTQLGEDGLPVGVGKFNWGAFLLPVFWPLAYNVPMYAGIAFAVHVAAYFLLIAVPALGFPLLAASLGVDIWVGFAAPRAFWKKYPNKLRVEEYRKKQRKWVVIGVALILLVFGFDLIVGMQGLGEVPTSL